MKNFYRLIPQAGIFAFLIFIFSNAHAQTSPTISYQGELLNNGSLSSGSQTMKILIYNSATGGTPLYTETQTVDVANGIFNVAIGSVTPLLPTLDFRKQYFLALSINGGAETSPRSLVSFAPYAFRALIADTASYATKATVSNGVSGGFVSNVNGESGTVTISGTNGITVSNNPPNIIIGTTGVQSLNTAGGKLTLVGAGGTTITDTGSVLTIRSATFTGGTGIQAVQNSDNAITITNGSGPIATLGFARQNADTGQYLAWSGSAWRPTSGTITGIRNADSTLTITNTKGPIDTIGLARQNATSGQVLVWNGSAWRPETVSGVGPDSIKNLGDARTNGSLLFLGRGSGINDIYSDTAGDANTGVGITALEDNTYGDLNTAIGAFALTDNTIGRYNSATGADALAFNTTGRDNTANGGRALQDNTTGSDNCAFGESALYDNVSGNGNTAVGVSALNVATGSSNVAVGINAQRNNFYRSNIVAVGDSALFWNDYPLNGTITLDSATENTGIGSKSLFTTHTGSYNTATGYQSLYSNFSGYSNTADGVKALWSNTGNYNTASGFQALTANTNGNLNTAFGYLALNQNTTGSNNTAFGDNSGPTTSGLTNTTSLGSSAQAIVSNSVVIGNQNVTSLFCQGAYAATTANAANMFVSATGQIMRSTSSARYKTNIHDLDINTDRLYDLRPVSYTSKIDGKEYFGLVAEDVAKVLPDLAEYARSKDVIPGSTSEAMIPDAVKYPMLSVLLLDELKKEHRQVESEKTQVEAQAKIIVDMERRLEVLEASQKAAR